MISDLEVESNLEGELASKEVESNSASKEVEPNLEGELASSAISSWSSISSWFPRWRFQIISSWFLSRKRIQTEKDSKFKIPRSSFKSARNSDDGEINPKCLWNDPYDNMKSNRRCQFSNRDIEQHMVNMRIKPPNLRLIQDMENEKCYSQMLFGMHGTQM